eukprot:356110-Chlamydomonas_euryale.AAC.4
MDGRMHGLVGVVAWVVAWRVCIGGILDGHVESHTQHQQLHTEPTHVVGTHGMAECHMYEQFIQCPAEPGCAVLKHNLLPGSGRARSPCSTLA